MQKQTCDFLIIGGGLFGVYAALYLAKKGAKVILVEKEARLMQKASIVNQARLHAGYHYPRSVATALMSDDNKARFTKDHKDFILFDYDKYYAIDRYGSFTDAAQFERFCKYIDIDCDLVKGHPLFNEHRLEAVFKTTEYTFDPILIARHYDRKIKEEKGVQLLFEYQITEAQSSSDHWEVNLQHLPSQKRIQIDANQVINATYSASNSINALFGLNNINLMHEISEMAFVTSPQLKNTGLTVMDGPFASIMPYGKSGLLSLSSVAYTHHKVSYDLLPNFDCQEKRKDCEPSFTSICNECAFKPSSNHRQMLAQIRQYLADDVVLHYYNSMFTIKSKLQANYIDDGRPTEIAVLHENPRFYCIFAGKINSIYEIEKLVN